MLIPTIQNEGRSDEKRRFGLIICMLNSKSHQIRLPVCRIQKQLNCCSILEYLYVSIFSIYKLAA